MLDTPTEKICVKCKEVKRLNQFKTYRNVPIRMCKVCENKTKTIEFNWLTPTQELNNKWLRKKFTK